MKVSHTTSSPFHHTLNPHLTAPSTSLSISTKFNPLIPYQKAFFDSQTRFIIPTPGEKQFRKEKYGGRGVHTSRSGRTCRQDPYVLAFRYARRHALLLPQGLHPTTTAWPQAQSTRVTRQVTGNACCARMKRIPQQNRNSWESNWRTSERPCLRQRAHSWRRWGGTNSWRGEDRRGRTRGLQG